MDIKEKLLALVINKLLSKKLGVDCNVNVILFELYPGKDSTSVELSLNATVKNSDIEKVVRSKVCKSSMGTE